ncbi:hypothetical protein XELAEV_18016157mg [Xenopus laevis]|uniref:Uncharacterized protein n=1 Tax=Xenopus laevis TaxID=8355 RepID=A0A974DKZ9_XENLA|nr:hypothetical protein XELAEV_18016157mg [Xenopus laevis]
MPTCNWLIILLCRQIKFTGSRERVRGSPTYGLFLSGVIIHRAVRHASASSQADDVMAPRSEWRLLLHKEYQTPEPQSVTNSTSSQCHSLHNMVTSTGEQPQHHDPELRTRSSHSAFTSATCFTSCP